MEIVKIVSLDSDETQLINNATAFNRVTVIFHFIATDVENTGR